MGVSRANPLPPGLGGFFSGILSVFSGLKRITGDQDMRKLAVLPLILTAILYTVMAFSIFYFSADVLAWIWARPDEGILRVLWYVVLPLIVLSLLVALGLLFTTAVEALGGPFFDRMATRVLKQHGVATREVGFFEGTIPDIARSLMFII